MGDGLPTLKKKGEKREIEIGEKVEGIARKERKRLYDKLLLIVTDAAAYMIKACKSLSVFYRNMIHVTCLCHALHRVAKEVRSIFPDVDALISNTKKHCSDLKIPPQPILTRWGSWIDTVVFYADNFQLIKTVIDLLDPEDAAAIGLSQKSFNDSNVAGQLAYIKANFSIIPTSITKSETRGLELNQALTILEGVKTALSGDTGEKGKGVLSKLDKVLRNNPGLKKLIVVAKILKGKNAETIMDMEPAMLALMKFAPLVSCDIERSFSIYNQILTEKRTNITPERLEIYLVSHCERK